MSWKRIYYHYFYYFIVIIFINALQVSAGRGGTVFDEDPKRWRLIAEGFTTCGRALEIATAVFPQQFVLLAGVLVSVLPKVGQTRGGTGGGGGIGLGGGGGLTAALLPCPRWGRRGAERELGGRLWLCLQLHCVLLLSAGDTSAQCDTVMQTSNTHQLWFSKIAVLLES